MTARAPPRTAKRTAWWTSLTPLISATSASSVCRLTACRLVPHAPAVLSGKHCPLACTAGVCPARPASVPGAPGDLTQWSHTRLHRINDNFCELLESGPKPTVAAIEGVALGGGLETALACNARLCSPGAATRARWVAVATCGCREACCLALCPRHTPERCVHCAHPCMRRHAGSVLTWVPGRPHRHRPRRHQAGPAGAAAGHPAGLWRHAAAATPGGPADGVSDDADQRACQRREGAQGAHKGLGWGVFPTAQHPDTPGA